MKVFDDPWTRGLLQDPVFHSAEARHAASLIIAGRGTKYERQHYTEAERRWAFQVLGKRYREP